MLTRDSGKTAQAVANEIGIHSVHAEVSPEDRHRIVRLLQSKGGIVTMTGDSINDTPALARADGGIAMGAGADVAIESASVTLTRVDLLDVARARYLSQATMQNTRQNLFFVFTYHPAGVAIAAGILHPFFGLLLRPMIAAAAMSLSPVFVIGNTLSLHNVALQRHLLFQDILHSYQCLFRFDSGRFVSGVCFGTPINSLRQYGMACVVRAFIQAKQQARISPDAAKKSL